jgi:DNA (cytosine-5)-methyltransferase 1
MLVGPHGRRALPPQQPLKVVGLFAGVGGIEEGFRRAGHEAVEMCEIDPLAREVLQARFPGVPIAADIREYRTLPADADLISAGFPCQDLSQAGRTLGLNGERSTLIEQVFWLLRLGRQPQWLLLENVPFMLRLASGETLRLIIDTLEELGYKWAYRVVDSRCFGIPQRRKRVYVLAALDADPRSVLLVDNEDEPVERFSPSGKACGFYWTEGLRGLGWAVDAVPTLKGGSTIGIPSPPGVWHPTAGIITPGIRDAERLQGFPANWTEPATTVGRSSLRWRLVGNAVTVDVAEWIGRRLRAPAEYHSDRDEQLPSWAKWPEAAYNVGEGRFISPASSYPVTRPGPSLADFLDLDEAQPLSQRATAGFLKRFESGSLRRPDGFVEAIRSHLATMEVEAA